MATQFAFPASPSVGQIASLPDGNQAQWNGYAWVEVGQAGVTYPIAVAKGGTGAVDAPTARINLGLNAATGEFIVQKDGTITNPGIAFASEPGLGWYRKSAGLIASTAGGQASAQLDASTAGAVQLTLQPRVNGTAGFAASNQVASAANFNYALFQQNANGSATLLTGAVGSATRGNLTLDAPQVLFNDGTVAAPNIAFASEPGLGWYRFASKTIAMAAQGQFVAAIDASSDSGTSFALRPRLVNGLTAIAITNQPFGAANYNALSIYQNADGSGLIQTGAAGTATRGNLTLDAPAVGFTGQIYTPGNISGGIWIGAPNTYGIWDNAQFWIFQFNSNFSGFRADKTNGDFSWVTNNVVTMQLQGIAGDLSILGGNAGKAVAGAWVANSDARIKDNIEDYTAGLAEVIQLRPRTFTFRKATGRSANAERFTSLIAQEAEAVMADLVSTAPGEVGDIKLADMRTLDITNITYALINAVKTLNARLEAGGL